MHPRRILYFDINGVLLNYDDTPKPALAGGILERELQSLAFGSIVCVSGWATVASEPVLQIPQAQRARWIHKRLKDIFPDEGWFCARTELYADSDRRGWAIDLAADWFYVDDRADKFIGESHGPALYEAERGRRIFQPDPYGDGADILGWLRRLQPPPRGAA